MTQVKQSEMRIAALESAARVVCTAAPKTSSPRLGEDMAWKPVLSASVEALLKDLRGIDQVLRACTRAGRLLQHCYNELSDEGEACAKKDAQDYGQRTQREGPIKRPNFELEREMASEILEQMMSNLQRAHAEV